MSKLLIRGASAAVMSVLFLTAELSQACCLCDWCCDWFKPKPVTYAPPPACAVCPQQVSYVPQTSYRTEYTCVPCTTCQAVNSCDPCGGAQTVMQPVTTYVRRPVMVPYTSYRPVVTQLNYAAASCTTCGAAYSSPYYTGAPMTTTVPAPGGCATCGGGTSVTYGAATVPAPAATSSMYATPGYAAAAGYATPGYAAPGYAAQPSVVAPPTSTPGMAAPLMGSPTPAPPSNTAVPNTFQPSSTMPQGSSSLMPATPIPDTDKSGNAPQLLDPQTRTTSAEIMGPATVTHAIFNTADRAYVFHPAGYLPTDKNQPQKSNDGWSAGSPSNSSTNDSWQPTDGR